LGRTNTTWQITRYIICYNISLNLLTKFLLKENFNFRQDSLIIIKGDCGSCYAVGALSMLEARMRI